MINNKLLPLCLVLFIVLTQLIAKPNALRAQEENTVESNLETAENLQRYEFNAEKMGSPMRILVYAKSQEEAENAVNKVWQRFDELNDVLSDYDPESEIIQVCRKSGESGSYVEISPLMRKTLEASRKYCELTNGAFDITVSPIVKLWRRSRSFHTLPPKKMLEVAKENVGLDVWNLSDDGVWVKPGVRFDVGGIAKGIALDEAMTILQENGITSALVDASGDLRIGDPPPNKEGWRVGVSSLGEEPLFYIDLANVGIASSGDANRYVEIDGVRYSHIIDPRSGNPLTRRCVSTVLAPTATTADALASSLCVLGKTKEVEEVLERINSEKNGKEGKQDAPIDYLLLQVKDNAEPPYTDEEIEVFISPKFEQLWKQK